MGWAGKGGTYGFSTHWVHLCHQGVAAQQFNCSPLLQDEHLLPLCWRHCFWPWRKVLWHAGAAVGLLFASGEHFAHSPPDWVWLDQLTICLASRLRWSRCMSACPHNCMEQTYSLGLCTPWALNPWALGWAFERISNFCWRRCVCAPLLLALCDDHADTGVRCPLPSLSHAAPLRCAVHRAGQCGRHPGWHYWRHDRLFRLCASRGGSMLRRCALCKPPGLWRGGWARGRRRQRWVGRDAGALLCRQSRPWVSQLAWSTVLSLI